MKASEIAEKIFEIEKELNLFEKQIQGVYFWKLVRLEVYQIILVEYKLMTLGRGRKSTFLEKLKRVLNILKNTYYYPSYHKKVDCIVLENPRKIKDENGEYYDPYTKYFVDELSDKSVSYEIVDLGLGGKHFEKASLTRRFADNFYFDVICRIFDKKLKITNKERKELEKLNSKFKSVLDVKINFDSIVVNQIKRFYLDYQKYHLLFKQKKNKNLYLVCSYGKEGIIKAAKDLDIKVSEFQHGTMTKYHVGYSFPCNSSVPYFPDELLFFGRFWSDSTSLPLKKDALRFIGYEDFNKKIQVYKDVEKTNKITFISQWTIGQKMIKKAIEVAKNNPQYKVVYRLHPSEYENKLFYLERIKKSELDNLDIGNMDKTLIEELAASKYVAGVYSTAIYEALALNCKVILLPLYGVEYMDYLIDNNYAHKINLSEKTHLESINLESANTEYFFGKKND